jgi:hypothetical protein
MNAPAAPAAVALTRSAWDDARAQHPAGTKLMRIIDLVRMTQRFDVLPPEGYTGLDLDGCTLMMPQLARSDAERLLILQVYDRLWFESPRDK